MNAIEPYDASQVQSGPPQELTVAISEALLLMGRSLANPKPHNAELVKIWALVLHLAGVQSREVSPITARLLMTEKFFPTPADFLAVARPKHDIDAQAELAWQRVKSAISAFGQYASLTKEDFKGDGAALYAVSRMGWGELCAELDVKNENLKRATFVRIYQMAIRENQSLDRLRGTFERENELRNRDLDPALCGRPDWQKLPSGDDGPVEEYKPLKPEAIKSLVAKISVPGDDQ